MATEIITLEAQEDMRGINWVVRYKGRMGRACGDYYKKEFVSYIRHLTYNYRFIHNSILEL
jgi:hypothetical protein